MAKASLLSNVNLRNRSNTTIQYSYIESLCDTSINLSIISSALKIKKLNVDAILVFNPLMSHLCILFLYKTILRGKAKITYFDLLLKKPIGFFQELTARIKGRLINTADHLACVHKDLHAKARKRT